MNNSGCAVEIPAEVLSNPSLLFLYYRIEQIFGIKAAVSALVELNNYLEKTCGASFIENPASYESLLSSGEQLFEISKIITINETYFFREEVHFSLLTALLPQLTKLNRTIQICSAATSTGCEAYSIAMLLDYYLREKKLFDFEVDAFDISAEAIETAQNGRYTENALRSDGSAWKNIYDSYLIRENGEYIVTQNIRGKVRFFTHNIMRGIDRQYDIIFFRNALIYFTPKNRLEAINNLVKSLFDNGYFIPGISEISSVQHPLLISRYLNDAFYFQKAENSADMEYYQIDENKILRNNVNNSVPVRADKPVQNTEAVKMRQRELPVSIAEITSILEAEEGRDNAKNTLDTLAGNNADSLNGSELAASIMYFLNIQDYNSAAIILPYLEKYNSGVFTRFLQGEYYYLQGKAKEAEQYFQEAAIKDKLFWPAFYRIVSLAADGDRTRYKYKIKKAMESIKLSQNHGETRYECFMGGFSPDYFRRVLEKKYHK